VEKHLSAGIAARKADRTFYEKSGTLSVRDRIFTSGGALAFPVYKKARQG
jgi:hypothetical protein